MNTKLFTILSIFLSLAFFQARGSHIVGGEVTYTYLGDSLHAGILYYKYQVSLSIYEDCLNGQPEAIAQDNPAFIGVFDAVTQFPYEIDTNINYASSITVPVNFNNSCVSNIPSTCLLKKTFIKAYALPANGHGYVVSYERCCRNASIVNVIDPGDEGSTYYCTIPGTPVTNNSAVFKNYPPQIICLNNPLFYDNSATDADGDSLSYGFCAALLGADDADIKPIPYYPNWLDTVVYVSPPYSSQVPMTGFPPIQINPSTGLITGTPNRIGRYLVTVFCNEWRDGAIVNTIKREFQFVVTDCSKVVVADIPQYSTDFNTYIVDCSDYTVNFVNTSTGGFAYLWNFGVPGTTSTSTDFEPTFTYPDTGTFTVKLVVNPGTTCPDSINRYVKVYPKFYASFADTGRQCPGAPISFQDLSSTSIKPITSWSWSFGDGATSSIENPSHVYSLGGTYNVTLVSENVKDCIDTAIRQVIVETFKPFAGDDTVIVKGESILFNATGGITYTWSPATNLSATNIYNPVGYYPDTGTYIYDVHVISNYGCEGDDTIKVLVVNHAEFVVPNAFTPNGDGRNDQFRPLAVGYRSLNYFRVFNRWGQRLYNATTLEVGWDGTYDNKQCDLGTYYWELSFVDRFGKEGVMKGDVTLIR